MGCQCYEWVGFVAFWALLAWFSLKLAKGIWTSWLGSALGFGYKWRPGPNSWAVITGSTDGIGLEYALEIGKKGYNLLLISRSPEKLDDVKDAIKAKAPKSREIRTLAIDFSKTDGIYEKIRSELDKLETIDILINNVGISYTTPEYFTKLDDTSGPGLIDKLFNVNAISCTRMLEYVLPKMEKQRSGLVINVSSLSAAYPTPLLSVYGATKIYVDFLSRSLNAEYADKGIIIQSVLPSFVATKMSRIRNTSFLVPSASGYVKGALKTIGLESRTYGYFSHKLQGFIQDHVLARFPGPDLNVALAFSNLKGTRAQYYKKKVNAKDK